MIKNASLSSTVRRYSFLLAGGKGNFSVVYLDRYTKKKTAMCSSRVSRIYFQVNYVVALTEFMFERYTIFDQDSYFTYVKI